MVHALATVLLGLSVVGIVLLAVQVTYAVRHLHGAVAEPTTFPWISILKPLCGVDDQLEQNLESFAAIEYANYEVLLGVERRDDPAYAVACRVAARWPERMRVVVQRGAPGLNPKVNQLITLARAARHDMLLVSDSNVVVAPRYLHEIAGLFENPRVGIVTHPIAGAGESTLGSLFDNLHLCTSITPGIISANGIARRPIVVGKSMALRRSELSAIGGFEAVKDVLAEDYVMGTLIVALCDKEVAVARRPITNMSCKRSLRSFLDRYGRWNVLQRTSVGHTTYMAALLLNPWPFALAAFIVEPSKPMGVALFACGLTKGALEYVAVRAARPLAFPWFSVLALPCKDVLLVVAWAMGFVRSEISWRGRWFAVLEGTRLAPVAHTRMSIFGRTAAAARNLHLIVSRSKST